MAFLLRPPGLRGIAIEPDVSTERLLIGLPLCSAKNP